MSQNTIAAMTIRACLLGIRSAETEERSPEKYLALLEKLAGELENPVYIVNMGAAGLGSTPGPLFYGSGAPAPAFQFIAPQADELTELAMHRADYQACKEAGFESPGELLSAHKTLEREHKELGLKYEGSLRLPKMPLPWTKAQVERAYKNNKEMRECVAPSAWPKVVKGIELMYGIRKED